MCECLLCHARHDGCIRPMWIASPRSFLKRRLHTAQRGLPPGVSVAVGGGGGGGLDTAAAGVATGVERGGRSAPAPPVSPVRRPESPPPAPPRAPSYLVGTNCSSTGS
mmetsp:Transcript_27021/g.93793  ORF Transcript_27021/g.93793 Transcript_27021/m.93793 type:complete len:108 (-) Transcript_27021:1235-1558(-)